MKKTPYLLLFLITLPMFTGCTSDTVVDDLLAGRQVDYKQSPEDTQKLLQYPPDLIASNSNIKGTVSLTQYTIDSIPNLEEKEIAVQNAVNVVYRRDGATRWVQVDLDANNLWPLLRLFWEDELGFAISRDEPDLGIMETDWLDLRRAATDAPGLRAYLDQFIGLVRDSGERDKFVTRLERNDNGGTDVWVSHRRLIAQFDRTGSFSGYESGPHDPALEIEMLKRIMLHLGKSSDEKSDQITLDQTTEINEQIAEVETRENNDPYEFWEADLIVKKPFLESWQLVQIGLNRGDFTIEDRDYQEGAIYIQHSGGPESEGVFEKSTQSFFNRLFGDKKPVLRTLKLVLKNEDEVTRVTVEAVEGDAPLSESQISFVLDLLHEWLP